MRKIRFIFLIMLSLAVVFSLASCDTLEGVLGELGIIEPSEPETPGDPCEGGHTYSTEWSHDTTNHWHDSTCEHNVKADEAEHVYTNGTCICGVAEPVISHSHTYSAEWSSDATKHWHASTCEHDVKADEAEHSYTAGICICGAIEPPAPHTHTYSDEWSSDAAKHWHASTCGHSVTSNEGAHDYDGDYVCTTCGYEHEHTYSITWSYNDDIHWRTSTCGHGVKADEAAHAYTDGTCACGAEEPEVPHTHTYSDEWSSDAEKHWHASTCGHAFKSEEGAHDYNGDYVCITCGYEHEHTYSDEWSYDTEKHWHASTCGHDVRGGEAEHFIGGDNACVGNCGYEIEVPHQHIFSSSWSKDETSHWRAAICEHTDEVDYYEAHSYGDDDVCSVCGYIKPIVITQADMRAGGWAYSDKRSYNTSGPRIGTKELVFVKAGTVIRYDPKGLQIYLDLPTTTTSTSTTAAADGSTRAGWLNAPGEYVVQADAYLGITVAKLDTKAAIAVSDYCCDIVIYPGNGLERTYQKQNVYRFGGEGNDWCFVYLPEGYDAERAEAYPFVIANHGNGWNMDGSAQKANWTDVGQYMSAAEIAKQTKNQDRYVATEDSSLWYSNATIEKLLAAGYIVCGAQNYGDNLYGNDDCTDAVVDFFNHMQETYNVEDSCHMIGASNGAMTTLNAVAKLGEKVKSIIIQYPLASIITHYAAGGHRDNIEKAYGLDTSKTYTKAELIELIGDYDPLYHNVVDGVKQGYFPAVKVYYSMSDTLTTANANALPLIEMLNKSGIECSAVRVDADGGNKNHGHADHFDPDAFLAWFEAH